MQKRGSTWRSALLPPLQLAAFMRLLKTAQRAAAHDGSIAHLPRLGAQRTLVARHVYHSHYRRGSWRVSLYGRRSPRSRKAWRGLLFTRPIPLPTIHRLFSVPILLFFFSAVALIYCSGWGCCTPVLTTYRLLGFCFAMPATLPASASVGTGWAALHRSRLPASLCASTYCIVLPPASAACATACSLRLQYCYIACLLYRFMHCHLVLLPFTCAPLSCRWRWLNERRKCACCHAPLKSVACILCGVYRLAALLAGWNFVSSFSGYFVRWPLPRWALMPAVVNLHGNVFCRAPCRARFRCGA